MSKFTFFLSVVVINCLFVVFLVSQTQASPDSSGVGQPQGRQDGSERSPTACPTVSRASEKLLTALVPKTTGKPALTTADSLTLLISNPYTFTAQEASIIARLSLQYQKYNVMKPIFLQLPATPGIIRIKLQRPLLEVQKNYQWNFAVVCRSSEVGNLATVSGTVQRVPIQLDLQRSLMNKSPEAQAEVYEQEKLWMDALAVTTEEYCNQSPTPVNSMNWSRMLKNLELSEVISEPFNQCINVEVSPQSLQPIPDKNER